MSESERVCVTDGKHVGVNGECDRQQFQRMLRGELYRYSRRELSNMIALSESVEFRTSMVGPTLWSLWSRTVHIEHCVLCALSVKGCYVTRLTVFFFLDCFPGFRAPCGLAAP